MFIIGIDIAKSAHEAIIMDSDGNVVQKAFRFQNSCTGYNKLLDKVRKFTTHRNQLVFGMESTGHYWLAIYTRLKNEGYQVHVLNPIQSDALRGLYIRQNKSDSRDSFIIAEVIRFGRFSETKVPQEKLHALRELCRNRCFMMDSVSDIKRKVITLLDQVFPEYNHIFTDTFGVASKEILLHYPTPQMLCRIRTSTLTNLLLKYTNGRYGQAKAVEIIETAKATFGVADTCGVYAELIQNYIKQIKFTLSQIECMDEKIAALMADFKTPITTITGIGPTLAAVILSEIGDISRFKSADKLAAFAGVDPTVKQSGDFVGYKNHMSKRGSPYLRRALWMASTSAVRHDPMFRAYYEKKAAEGMKYMKIIGHVTKKMTSVIFAVLRDNKPYQPMIPASVC
ncbi:IS110 family transposase [Ruminococcaceae bacterium OttesenSCG-928-L11]|nr:IS110 family transposase [Ruminococcaceae bacterium OttesenSCG-928-L11]